MKIAMVGSGYVGLVSGACFADFGHEVVCIDKDPSKIERLNAGAMPIYEPGLSELVAGNVKAGRLSFTTNLSEGIAGAGAIFIAVGTPSRRGDGHADLSFVYAVAQEVGSHLSTPAVIVTKSTVPVGTGDEVERIIASTNPGVQFAVASNPEFLREGSSIRDFDQPAYTIVGTEDPQAEAALRELYADVPAPLHVVPTRVAEMVKYTANAFHAVKITFANEIGLLARQMGVDGRDVMSLIVQDTKLNVSPAYLRPGFAYGGSCLPKDVSALLHLARREELSVPLLASLPRSNHAQIERVADAVLATGARRVTVLGLAFKAGTDDLRESPAVELVERLIGRGCDVRILDRAVQSATLLGANREYIERRLPHVSCLLTDDPESLIHDAQAIVVTQNQKEFSRLLEGVRPDVPVFDVAGIAVPAHVQVQGVAW